MRKPFWSLVANGRYQVGCTGQTVYVLDRAGNELARFRDMTYAYYPALHPDGDIAAVFSNNGVMAVYSLSELRLVKKFRVSAVNATQTGRFPCFSPDGRYLYHIEGRKGDGCNSRLSVYSTAEYQLVRRLFEEGQETVFDCMEIDEKTGGLFLLGYFRRENTLDYFVARWAGEALTDVRPLDTYTRDFYQSAIHIKQSGYTETSYQWSDFLINPKIKPEIERSFGPADWGPFNREYTLEDLKRMDLSLSRLWEGRG